MTEPLPADVALALRAAADRIGACAGRISYVATVSSTNDVALRLAVAGADDGTAVLAGAQAAGRGRQGRRWFSPPGAGLYFSLVLRQRAGAGDAGGRPGRGGRRAGRDRVAGGDRMAQ